VFTGAYHIGVQGLTPKASVYETKHNIIILSKIERVVQNSQIYRHNKTLTISFNFFKKNAVFFNQNYLATIL
jgi:hypothetical protein